MTYQVLARKWRPREFSSLIGQQAVVTALTNALREGRIAQAYLFSGIRGVGKTTAARLFAKALNCEKGPENGPCNECVVCAEITSGADLDVLEIDAATYSKVEQVRELAESLKYGPARDRYKVVVLDEVHRLSRQAFDALLKIIEEPPPRLVFLFATTEIGAVPATILSRCQEFHFRRVSAEEVAAHLGEIAKAEGIEASDRALTLLARAGEGSVRDSVALLDQLATFGNGTVEDEEAARLVGGLDLALFAGLLSAVLRGDSATVSSLARDVEAEGWDPRQVHTHFLSFCRDALHLALDGDPRQVDPPPGDAEALAETARAAGYENLLRLLHHLLASEAAVRRSETAGLALEIAWLRAAELPKLVRVEALLAGETPAGGRLELPPAPSPAAAPRRRAEPGARTAPESRADPAPVRDVEPPAAEPAPPEPPAAEPASAPDQGLARFRQELSARRPTVAARLESARLAWVDGQIEIALPGDDPGARRYFERQSNRELLSAAATAAFGAGTRWRFAAAGPAPARGSVADDDGLADEAAPGGDEEATQVAGDPRVQAVLDIFGGSVAAVVHSGDDPEESEDSE